MEVGGAHHRKSGTASFEASTVFLRGAAPSYYAFRRTPGGATADTQWLHFCLGTVIILK